MMTLTQVTASAQIWRLPLVLALLALASCGSQATDVVEVAKDAHGWKLRVEGKDYFIKGVVWEYTPRGEKAGYQLWEEPEEQVRAVLDYDFSRLQAAGVNTIRSFSMLPPKWVTYVYEKYGVRSVINPMMGRYGTTVDGIDVKFTDYSDEATRRTLKAESLNIVRKYRDVPGVLLFAFGNESNYGLSWSSFEIEDLPEGEQQIAKARYLYSLFNEVVREGKEIAPDKPFTFVNGDLQYIDLIAELCPDIDLLGSNVYRGPSFTGLWRDVQEKLDLPIVLFEFGSDAYNALEQGEDEVAQAQILKDQWLEMYNKASGNGEEGNALGGFVFEWRDEWWKYQQDRNLDIHDETASWSNKAYGFDWLEGENNMNEEWFGIVALGPRNDDGVHTAEPRVAYHLLSRIWSLDPYTDKKSDFAKAIGDLDPADLATSH